MPEVLVVPSDYVVRTIQQVRDEGMDTLPRPLGAMASGSAGIP